MENNQPTYKINIKLSVVLILMLPFILGMFSTLNAQTNALYGIIDNHLVIIDETTGITTNIGNLDDTLKPIENLAYDSVNDKLYAIANFSTNPRLITIDRLTSATTIIGDIDFLNEDVGTAEGLAFNRVSGKLYGALEIVPPVANYNSNLLSTLNISGSKVLASQIASITGTCENELDAMEFTTSEKLYFIDYCNTYQYSKLYTNNNNIGASTFIGNLLIEGKVRDMAYNIFTDQMFGATTNPTTLVKINLDTTATTIINLTIDPNELDLGNFRGIAFAPKPIPIPDTGETPEIDETPDTDEPDNGEDSDNDSGDTDHNDSDDSDDSDDSENINNCEIPCDNKKNKVLVCHIPPGNSDNKHEICINKNALKAHLDHGDYCGPCQEKESALGVEQLKISEPSFSIYPNPFNDTFFIALDNDFLNKNLELELYDILGRTVLIKRKINKTKNEINLRGMKNGLYIYSLRDDNGTNLTGKIIKN